MPIAVEQSKLVHILDYGAGNVRSVRNAIRSCGYEVADIKSADEISTANIIVFPGVGNIRQAMAFLSQGGYAEALRAYIKANKRYLGICLGLQTLFEKSEEASDDEVSGLGIIPGVVKRFPVSEVAVPHIGWNGIKQWKDSPLFLQLNETVDHTCVYFVHTYRATVSSQNKDWVLTTTNYGSSGEFISSIQKGNVMATQFHPEKSGRAGLDIIKAFLLSTNFVEPTPAGTFMPGNRTTLLSKRIIACLDVRSNDSGDLVVTKGDQYEVRESSAEEKKGKVRNLGKPVDLCERYYNEGADEIAFLNICSFREEPMADSPMVKVLEEASKKVFVPLTIGGGIRGYTDSSGKIYSALDVASMYFRAGADKVSLGSDAVYAAEKYFQRGKSCDGTSSVEQISEVYGKQAVVVSLDPKRVYVDSSDKTMPHDVVELSKKGPNGESYAWYQATVRGGREGRQIDAVKVAQAAEALGAGEILLNCVDMDGQKQGYDLDLVSLIKESVGIPVIASSGAGIPEHFSEVFSETGCHAALAAGIFHRHEVSIEAVKNKIHVDKIPVRRF